MQRAAIMSILLELRSRLRSPGIDAGYLSMNCCRNISTVNFLPKNCCQNRKMPKIARLLNDSKTWRSPKTIGRRPLCFSEEPRLRETQEKAHKFKKHEGKSTRVFAYPNKISALRYSCVPCSNLGYLTYSEEKHSPAETISAADPHNTRSRRNEVRR